MQTSVIYVFIFLIANEISFLNHCSHCQCIVWSLSRWIMFMPIFLHVCVTRRAGHYGKNKTICKAHLAQFPAGGTLASAPGWRASRGPSPTAGTASAPPPRGGRGSCAARNTRAPPSWRDSCTLWRGRGGWAVHTCSGILTPVAVGPTGNWLFSPDSKTLISRSFTEILFA